MPPLPSPGLSFSEFQKFWRDEAITNGWQIPNEPTIHGRPMTEAEAVKSEERIERFRNRFREAEKYRQEQAEAAATSSDERIRKVTQNMGKPIIWDAHRAAASGRLWDLKEIARTQSRSELFMANRYGWRPIHEAARSGHADVLEYLLEEGAKVNERTNNNNGGNALFWAKKNAKKNAKAIAVLEKYGAVVIEPRSPKVIEDYINYHYMKINFPSNVGKKKRALDYVQNCNSIPELRSIINRLFNISEEGSGESVKVAATKRLNAMSPTRESSKVIDDYIDDTSNPTRKERALDYVQNCNSIPELRSIINRLFNISEEGSGESVKVAATKRLNAMSPTASIGKYRFAGRAHPFLGRR